MRAEMIHGVYVLTEDGCSLISLFADREDAEEDAARLDGFVIPVGVHVRDVGEWRKVFRQGSTKE